MVISLARFHFKYRLGLFCFDYRGRILCGLVGIPQFHMQDSARYSKVEPLVFKGSTFSPLRPVLAVGLLLPRFAWSTPRLNQLKLITLAVL